MKIFLALPPHSLVDRYNKAIAKAAGSFPPLGLLYLAAVLRAKGHKVQVCDGSMEDYNTMLARMRAFQPDLLGFSTMAFLWHSTKEMIAQIRKEFPNTYIALGGNHATNYKKACLAESPESDLIMFGECEETVVEVADAIERKLPFENIKGLIFRNESKTIQTADRPLIQNLDSLPSPARDLVNINDYVPAIEQYKRLPVTNLMSSRGCPFRCTFCTQRQTGMRMRSAQNVFEEIRELVHNYKIKEIAFWDDTFTLNRSRVMEIAKLIKESKLDIIWSMQARVNTVDRELLKNIASAGCWKIFYGVESLVQKNLDKVKKDITVSQAFDAIRWTREAGIESEASFIFGIPGETYEEALTTMNLAIKLNPSYAKFFQHTFFEGMAREDIENEGIIIGDDLQGATGNSVTFVPHTMSHAQLASLVPRAYKKFYMRPAYIINYFKKIRSIEDIKRAVRGAQAVLSLGKK